MAIQNPYGDTGITVIDAPKLSGVGAGTATRRPMGVRTPSEWEERLKKLQEEYAAKAGEFTPEQIDSLAGRGPTELQNVLTQRQSALQGYEAPELAAMRASMAGTQQAAQQERERALQAALAQQGIRGGSAAALQAQMAQRAAGEQAQQETQLMLAQEQRQREALGEYEQTAADAYTRAQTEEFMPIAAKLAMEQLAQAQYLAEMGKESEDLYTTEMAEAQKEAGGCCFIFLEVGNGELDRIARRARDELMTDRNRRGYYKLSEVFVPLMRKSGVFKALVKWTMVKPMIAWGKWYYGESKINRVFEPVAMFWFRMFDYLGQNHPFIRENGEVV